MSIGDDSLSDLSDLVGPELASLVNPAKATQVTPPTTGVTTTAAASTSTGTATTSSTLSDMPADISDLRSSDLLQTLPGMIDIDRIFADFQAEHQVSEPRRSSPFSYPGVYYWAPAYEHLSTYVLSVCTYLHLQWAHEKNL